MKDILTAVFFCLGIGATIAQPVNDTIPPLETPFPPSVTPPQYETGKECTRYNRRSHPGAPYGTTKVSFKIEQDGTVKDVKVLESSGDKNLDETAVACAGRWRYKPAMQDGQPVEVIWKVAIPWSDKR